MVPLLGLCLFEPGRPKHRTRSLRTLEDSWDCVSVLCWESAISAASPSINNVSEETLIDQILWQQRVPFTAGMPALANIHDSVAWPLLCQGLHD